MHLPTPGREKNCLRDALIYLEYTGASG